MKFEKENCVGSKPAAFSCMKLPIRGSKGTGELMVLFDSGADRSVIGREKAESICNIEPLEESLKMANGEAIPITGRCLFSTTLKDNTTKQKCSLNGTAWVSPEFRGTHGEEMIIGLPELQDHGIGFKFARKKGKEKGRDRLDLSHCVHELGI